MFAAEGAAVWVALGKLANGAKVATCSYGLGELKVDAIYGSLGELFDLQVSSQSGKRRMSDVNYNCICFSLYLIHLLVRVFRLHGTPILFVIRPSKRRVFARHTRSVTASTSPAHALL
jgi:hypothetical protein